MRRSSFFLLSVCAALTALVMIGLLLRRDDGVSGLVSTGAHAVDKYREVSVTINAGDTLDLLARTNNVAPSVTAAILEAASPHYNLAKIRAGKEIIFYFSKETDELAGIVYEPNVHEQIRVIKLPDSGWTAEKNTIQYEIRRKKISATIDSSLYEAGLAHKVDERAIISLAEVFQWVVNFAVDVQKGDSFTMIYEERFRDGAYVMPGRVLAASFTNKDKTFYGYYYAESEDHDGYFDETGASLERMLLKVPLQYRYISSGFTGRRVNPFTGHTGTHYAIDYAANHGTPAVSVGDGTVTFAGWRTGYGYSVDIQHNEAYKTRYGHFSRLAVKSGQRVTQGQTIGYVGSTGWSTGPHLHYELYKYGTPVNPLTVELPASKGLSIESAPAFQEVIKQYSL